MKHIKIYEDFLNEANRSKRGNNKINFLKDSTSDVDHTRLVKWMGQHIDSNKYSFEKSKIVGYWILDVKKLSERELKDLLQYLDSEKYKFGTEIWLPAYIEEGLNEDYRNTDPSLKEYVGKKVKAILEDDDGENSYVTIQFNDNTQMKITAYPMGSGGVGLVVESLNEAIDTKYWATYNKDTSGQGNRKFELPEYDFDQCFDYAVEDWNDEADGPENKIKGAAIGKIKKMAKEFFKKEGYISVNIIQAMIAQDGAMTEAVNIDESTIQYFKPTVLDKKNTVNDKFFKKLMPRTASTTEEAMERIWHFEDSTMFAHYQYHIVKPNGNKPNRPTYRLHQSQYWLSSAYDNQIKNLGLDPKEGVNTTIVTIFDITDPANEINLGKVWVDTRQFLDELNRVFEVIKRAS